MFRSVASLARSAGRSAGSPPKASAKGPRRGVGMHDDGRDAANHTLRLVKNSELPQEGGAVIIRPLSSQPVRFVKGEDPTKRQFGLTARRGKASPRTKVHSPNDDYQHDGVECHVAPLDVKPEPWERLQRAGVECGDVALRDAH
jgi:hypothetical protein